MIDLSPIKRQNKVYKMLKMSRRNLILIAVIGVISAAILKTKSNIGKLLSKFDQPPKVSTLPDKYLSNIYLSKNGSPQENTKKAIEMMGGIGKFIGKKDIVIIKPNAQWWNQGRTNISSMKAFIDEILNIEQFCGEVIIAENTHFMNEDLDEPDNVRGWTHYSVINGDIDGKQHNLNTLIESYHEKKILNVTKYHWRDGKSKREWFGNGQDGGLVSSPTEGDGYIWTDIDYIFTGCFGLKRWKVKMSYPVFTSRYSGITIDFQKGAFLRDGQGGGRFLDDRPIKFINFAALNDHGGDTGITSSIKNYMGITDLSCGYWGHEPQGYANVHYCGEDFYPYAKAGVIGHFMKTIRIADLNVVTAEWVGWGDRTDISRAERMRTILMSTDPVALDYYGAKYLVYPLSRRTDLHNPDNPESSVSKFLNMGLLSLGKGTVDEKNITVHQHDFDTNQEA